MNPTGAMAIRGVTGGDDPLASTGKEKGVADLLERLEIISVDRWLDCGEPEDEDNGEEKPRAGEIHGRGKDEREISERERKREREKGTDQPPKLQRRCRCLVIVNEEMTMPRDCKQK